MSNLLIQDNENIIIYADDLIKDINEDFFETNKWLQSKSYDLTDTGRGETIFFEYQNLKCVLKHYFRGGILGDYIRDRYLWTGIDGSRSIREFRRLEELSAMGLPVPKPIGARVKKSGATYTADLITIEIENSKTLSELIIDDDADNNVWKSIGKCLHLFNNKEIYHPDLNTNNILIDDELNVYLIDFDTSSRLHQKISSKRSTLDRFHRSLKKTFKNSNKKFLESDWNIILSHSSID